MERLIPYLDGFEGTPVLVVGDLMVDHYVWGKVSRISPEAPVPVVEVTRETLQLGGAANVAHNILTLGGVPLLCGVVGEDDKGGWLQGKFREMGVATEGIVTDSTRRTTQKTRVIAHHQHVVRFDYEQRDEISPSVLETLLSRVRTFLRRVSVVVISDYAKGIVNPALLKEVRGLAAERGVRIIVDPKVRHFEYYEGATLITPNTQEASQAVGFEIRNESDLRKAGEALLRKTDCQAVLITRGEEGMTLFERGGEITPISALPRDVFDVTGAGDTVVGTLALAAAAGVPWKDAARLANVAAGWVVGCVGTATVTRAQLTQAIRGEG